MNRFERLVRIHRLLQPGRPVTMRRLVEDLGVVRSTVTRDLAYLRDMLGAPIVYDRETNGHRYDREAEAFELPGLWLNQSELYALLATEQILEAAQPGLLGPYLGPLKARVRRLLGQAGRSAESIGDRIRLIESGRRTLDSEEFGVVAEGVLGDQRLGFEYRGRARGDRRQRRVHPQRLIHYRSNWYLVAHCEEAEDLRLFSLDRMRGATLLDGICARIDAGRLDRWIGASYGIFTGTAHAWARLRFTADAARWAAEERWHPDQLGVWQGRGFELQVPYADATELTMEILRYGPEVEVIGPDALREEVVERVRAMGAMYLGC